MQALPFSTRTELVTDIPIRQGSPYTFDIIYSLPLTLQVGDIVSGVVAQFEATSEQSYNVMFGHRMVLSQQSSAVNDSGGGVYLACAATENITPSMHHGFRTVTGIPYTVTQAGTYYINMVIYAASSAAQTGHTLAIEQGYGHLACVVLRPTSETPPVEPTDPPPAQEEFMAITLVEHTGSTSLTTQIPMDDTIPQSSEGTEIINHNYTMKNSANKLIVRFDGMASSTAYIQAALFKNTDADALGVGIATFTNGTYAMPVTIPPVEIVPAAATIDLKVRIGTTPTKSMRMNGVIANRLYGGAAKSTLTIIEVPV